MSNPAVELSKSLAAAVATAGPAVVRIVARRRGPSSGVVWSEDGAVVTAEHVLEWDEEIEVGLADGATATARVAGRDPSTDLAVLRVQASGLTPAPWADAEDLALGSLLLGVSRPGRLRAALGVVSTVGDGFRTPAGGRIDREIRTDLGIHTGFSGSLALDAGGRAVGLCTAGIWRATPVVVPTSTLRRVVGTLLTHGHVRRGYLGIATQPVRLPGPLAERLGQASGLLVVAVEPGTPAERGGLLLGDVLVAFAGQPLTHPAELLHLLSEETVGADVAVRLVRAGEVREVPVTVGSRNGREAS